MLQKMVIQPPFSCFTRSRGPASFRYMTVHLYPPRTRVIQTHLLPPTGARVRCLSAIIALTANPPTFFCFLHYHPVTNIYTAKEGVACVITVSASEASFLAPPGRREGRGGVKAQMASAQTRQPQSRAPGMSHAQVTRQQLGNTRNSNERNGDFMSLL